MLMNQHMLLHLVKSVYDHRPLWSSSLFVFEDWNGDIGNYFHETQNIANQVGSCIIIIMLYENPELEISTCQHVQARVKKCWASTSHVSFTMFCKHNFYI